MPVAIKAENVSKVYQLGEIGTGTISRDLERWYARRRGKEDPFLKIGELNDRTKKGVTDVVWSLKDINFQIERGEAVGIIGRNGAGKSTLLKILSRITSPTTGRIRGNGRVSSLLEVGTGFNPELTGRENIFLNGTILGMRKAEIRKHFDAIVDFSGVERYIDTPVKRYSSGMYVRLAFGVAAHLESEILIVDEVLAVGDAEFQKKCLGKMGEVTKGEGRTVFFVSHNMHAIEELCTKGIVLENGMIMMDTTANEAISYYQKSQAGYLAGSWNRDNKIERPAFTSMQIALSGKQPDLVLEVKFEVNIIQNIAPALVAFGIKNSLGAVVMQAYPSLEQFIKFDTSGKEYACKILLNNLIPDQYTLHAWLGAGESEVYDWVDNKLGFEVFEAPMVGRTIPYYPQHGSVIAPSYLLE